MGRNFFWIGLTLAYKKGSFCPYFEYRKLGTQNRYQILYAQVYTAVKRGHTEGIEKGKKIRLKNPMILPSIFEFFLVFQI